MKKYIEILLFFVVPFLIAIILGYLNNNIRIGIITGFIVGIIFAIFHISMDYLYPVYSKVWR